MHDAVGPHDLLPAGKGGPAEEFAEDVLRISDDQKRKRSAVADDESALTQVALPGDGEPIDLSPVVRTPSLNAIDAVSALRGQHMCPFDVPGAYLQGKQRDEEQIVTHPPVGFRSPASIAAMRWQLVVERQPRAISPRQSTPTSWRSNWRTSWRRAQCRRP